MSSKILSWRIKHIFLNITISVFFTFFSLFFFIIFINVLSSIHDFMIWTKCMGQFVIQRFTLSGYDSHDVLSLWYYWCLCSFWYFFSVQLLFSEKFEKKVTKIYVILPNFSFWSVHDFHDLFLYDIIGVCAVCGRFTAYCENTTLHGFQYIPKAGIWSRFFLAFIKRKSWKKDSP